MEVSLPVPATNSTPSVLVPPSHREAIDRNRSSSPPPTRIEAISHVPSFGSLRAGGAGSKKKHHQYFLSAIKSTAIVSAVTCSFTHPNATNLVCNKCNRLEIFLLSENHIDLLLEVPIWGRVHSVNVLRPPHGRADLLWIITVDFKCAIICYDMKNREVKTIWDDCLEDFFEGFRESSQICKVDSSAHFIAISMIDSFKVLRLDYTMLEFHPGAGYDGAISATLYNLPLDLRNIIDFDFLETGGANDASVAILHSDDKQNRHLRTFALALKVGQLVEGRIKALISDPYVSMLHPVQDGGVLVLSQQQISYHHQKFQTSSPTHPDESATPVAVGQIGVNQFLVGDALGHLFLLELHTDKKNHVNRLKRTLLGVTSQSSSITKLAQLEAPEGVAHLIFIASIFGDSQLLMVIPANQAGSKVEVIRSFTNIGPMPDFVLVPTLYGESTQMVGCSGTGKDGCLSIIRNGLGLVEHASFDQPGVQNIWALKRVPEEDFDSFLVYSFVGETRVMTIGAEEIREVLLTGVSADRSTIYAGNFGRHAVQVTAKSVRCIEVSSFAGNGPLLAEWMPQATQMAPVELVLAGGDVSHLYVATSHKQLYILKPNSSTPAIESVTHRTFSNDIACVTLHSNGTILALIEWNSNMVHLLTVPELKSVCEVQLQSLLSAAASFVIQSASSMPSVTSVINDSVVTPSPAALASAPALSTAIPHPVPSSSPPLSDGLVCRSATFQRFNDGPELLLIGLGDGTLLCLRALTDSITNTLSNAVNLSSVRISHERTLTLGTEQLLLRPFQFGKEAYVFVCSDRSCVLLPKDGRIGIVSVNVPQVSRACTFRYRYFSDTAVVLCSGSQIKICSISDIQKLHVRKVPLGRTPWRVTHLPHRDLYAVLLLGEERYPLSAVRLLSGSNSQMVAELELPADRIVCGLTATTFEDKASSANANAEYIIVSMALPNADEPTALSEHGEIAVFTIEGNELKQVSSVATQGLGYGLVPLHSNLVASCNGKVNVFTWKAPQLFLVSSLDTNVMTLSAHVLGDYILLGDLIQSVSLLIYRNLEGKLELVSKETSLSMVSACDFFSAEGSLVALADNKYGLHVLRLVDAEPSDDSDIGHDFKVDSSFCAGESIHRLQHGVLVHTELTASSHHCSVVYSSVNGSIGVLSALGDNLYRLFDKLQRVMRAKVPSVGNFSHRHYRYPQFGEDDAQNAHAEEPVIDGDYISHYLELSLHLKQSVAAALQLSVEELVAIIESHHQSLV